MKLTSAFCATAAVILLAGCAYETPAPAVAIATPSGTVVATTGITGDMIYYDRFYGQVYSGYWGSDGLFHYQLVSNGPWMIDTSRHFRHESATGFEIVSITPPVDGAIVATTEPAASVYYDKFYGPIDTGYWGSDGMFHYRLVSSGPWLIDRSRHFRRNAATGFEVVTITPVTIPPG